MIKRLVLLLLLFSLAFAEFKLEGVDVVINDIQKDGSARVTEHIKIFVVGTYEQEKYKAGLGNNDLSSWAELTSLGEVKMHISSTNVDILGFSLRPQTLNRCDPFLDLCHGELILSYIAKPYFNKTTGESITGTGLFSVDNYKPRTTRYLLNPAALNFRTAQRASVTNSSAIPEISNDIIILDKNIYLTVDFPSNTVILDVSQAPENIELTTPTASVSELRWTNTILGQFVLSFEVEENLDKEVVEFFSAVPRKMKQVLESEQGMGTLAIIVILIASYAYLKSMEKKR
ncbi:MAG: hypothetical protein WCT31_02045 [Candidatus Micrarchaeia archaeon]|jgi:hypothetical protein